MSNTATTTRRRKFFFAGMAILSVTAIVYFYLNNNDTAPFLYLPSGGIINDEIITIEVVEKGEEEKEVEKEKSNTTTINTINNNSESTNPDQQQNKQSQKPMERPRSKRRPNVLLLMTDQQRFDAIRRVQDELSHYDNTTKIRTPNLDRLSQRGVYFRNAYTQCSVCGPARTSLRTGCTIERTGVQTNGLVRKYSTSGSDFFERRVKSMPRSLDHYLVEDLKYRSEYYGKTHLPNVVLQSSKKVNNNNTKDDRSIISYNLYDFKEQQFVFESEDWGWSSERQYKDYLKQNIQQQRQQNGDDFLTLNNRVIVNRENKIIYMEDGMQIDTYSKLPYTPIHIDSRYGYPTNTTLKNSSMFPDQLQTQGNVCGNFSLSENYTDSYFTWSIAKKALKRLMTAATATTTTTEKDENREQDDGTGNLRARRNNNYDDEREKHDDDDDDPYQPFFLTVSFHHPHPPMVPAWKYLNHYWEHRDTLFVSPSIHDSLETSPYEPSSQEQVREKYANAEYVQGWTASYYALVEQIDNYIGDILEQLDSIPEIADNTLIIFTSDHGEMLGSHGRRDKSTFLEEASHVPLFMSLPGAIPENITVDDLASHIDIVSTILDYVGAPSTLYEGKNDGRSLRRFIEKNSYNKDYDEGIVVGEWDFRDPVKSKDGKTMELARKLDSIPSFLIRKGPFKLMMHKKASSKKIDGLYNLEIDPFEMDNLLSRQGDDDDDDRILAKAEHLRCLLLDWMERMDGNEGYYSDPAANFGEGEGDIEEIRKRQAWRPLNFWISDSELEFGTAVKVGDSFVRKEYLYLGRRASGLSSSLIVANISIEGKDAEYFTVDKDTIEIVPNECFRIQVVFSSLSLNVRKKASLDAFISLQQENSDDKMQIKLLFSGQGNP